MMMPGKRIVFVINSLTDGGAERVLIELLAGLREHLAGFDTHLVLLDREEERHAVPNWVEKHVLDTRHDFATSMTRLFLLLRHLGPAVVLSFLNRANCANAIAGRMLGYRCIISERVHTTSHFGAGSMALVNRAIVRFTYRLADQVIAVSQGIRKDLVENYGVAPRKVQVIHNPIDAAQIIQRAAHQLPAGLPDRYILGIGRLTRNKNFPLLIESYLAAEIPEKLVIMGDGEEHGALEQLISRSGLCDRVQLMGYVDNPYPIIKSARLFVSSSNAEGFPNALVEAMALGCPVVATDCDTGPMEILTGRTAARCDQVMLGAYGILVPPNSVACLASAIRTACRDEIRAEYSRLGQRRAKDFDVGNSVALYWSAIGSLA
jgi:N-acetylgalactosamine-N,N'-diacetylbacillosaminyl-diphospho-undecaprenol 4-alpha-N-acetylgalactosaminyltransferase